MARPSFLDEWFGAGHMARVEEMRSASEILARKPEGKRDVWKLGVNRMIIFICM
jgi:hypothetical protein